MTKLDERERGALEAAKRASVGQLLFKCAHLLNDQALARVRQKVGVSIRPAHSALFPHIDLEGTRLTDVARRMGISKQAVSQLVSELEEMGVVERVSDPRDGRAKLIRFARLRGRLWLHDGLSILGEFERHLADKIGQSTMQELHRCLVLLLMALEEVADPG
ncbi:MAG: MarR family transcriptional regulator [Proteobacteria bacterium]|nr:MarR family transcriptional regulator [Pseudomonadota bacterium]